MESPLWTETYAPNLSDLPQPAVRDYLERAVNEPINIVLYGPEGCGKTAAVRALAREAHDDPDNDLVEINVADFFDRTKKEIRNDPRFSNFLQGETEFSKQYRHGSSKRKKYKRQWSKREMINHVLKEYAGYAPSSGEYKTIVLDNAEAIREDFQQALRRVMEQYHETTQFVITTRQPTKLIPPIKSRCFPVSMRSPTEDEIIDVLEPILEAENAEYDEMGLRFVAGYAKGDLRKAILGAQLLHEQEGAVTTDAYQVLREFGIRGRVEKMMEQAENGQFTDARSSLDELLIDEGYSGDEVLEEIMDAFGRSNRYTGESLAEAVLLAAEVDMDLTEGTNDRLHISHLLAELGAGS
ncbi:AAA family ATPase [Haladaptatus caseinilyticus]|uniref:AAA family ATPase n=1 Tax=Haladaptatus caseinilyticus TaxID=2993314 RepID=UPI00224AE34E|nr:AAA family ATPase [Haladaptatus caseinilyticus]